MRVGIDICNTIANVNLELLRYFRISFDKYPSPEIPEGFFGTSRSLDIFMKAEPFPGSQKALTILVESGYIIEYITNRPLLAEFVTKRWLALHWFPPGRVIFTKTPEDKVNCAIQRSYTAFFEDDPRTIELLLRKGIEVFVKDWEYNRSLKHDLMVRFKRWSEVTATSGVRLGV
ncbi:MAG: hypothetical protein K6T80_08065 [Firmicutes bacterium]|nr:hypothetical protein [Bacillota bacterium]